MRGSACCTHQPTNRPTGPTLGNGYCFGAAGQVKLEDRVLLQLCSACKSCLLLEASPSDKRGGGMSRIQPLQHGALGMLQSVTRRWSLLLLLLLLLDRLIPLRNFQVGVSWFWGLPCNEVKFDLLEHDQYINVCPPVWGFLCTWFHVIWVGIGGENLTNLIGKNSKNVVLLFSRFRDGRCSERKKEKSRFRRRRY